MNTSPQKESDGWPNVPLDQICAKIQDGTHFSPKAQFSEPAAGRYKYVTAKNIRPWGLDLTDITYIDKTAHRDIFRRCNPERGDVLLTKDGANTGMVAINNVGEEFSLLSSVALLKPRKDLLDARFLRYFIESPQGTRGIIGKMSGTAIRRIILKRIKEATIPLAPLREQQRIVAEIEKQFTRLDAAVASLKRVQIALKRYRASVLKAACEGRLVPTEAELARNENRSYETGEELLRRILKKRREKWNGKGKYKEPVSSKDADLPTLPEGWTWATVGQLTDESMIGLDRGRSQQTDGPDTGVPYIKMNNVTMEGRVIFEKVSYVPATLDEKARFHVREDDVLFNTRNSKELVGKVGIVRNPPANAIYNNNLMRLRFADGVIPAVVNLQMISHDFRRRMELVKKATTNVAAVYGKDLFPLPIALPPVGEQWRIVAEAERRVSVLDELANVVGLNLSKAQALRRAFLQAAFEGRLSNYGD